MSDDAQRHAEGMEVRRAVLGDSHVDRAESKKSEFTEGFQDFITRYAWGEVWTGDGVDRRTRSCLTLAILAATGCGLFGSVQEAATKLVKYGETTLPEPELTEKYAERYLRYRRLYPAVKELF